MALDLLDPMATDADHLYEVIDGQPVLLSDHVASAVVSSRLADLLNQTTMTGLGIAYSQMLFKLPLSVDRNRRPDVAFVPYSVWPRTRPLPNTNAWTALPELCVEVVSPTDLAEEVMTKVTVLAESKVVRTLRVRYRPALGECGLLCRTERSLPANQ